MKKYSYVLAIVATLTLVSSVSYSGDLFLMCPTSKAWAGPDPLGEDTVINEPLDESDSATARLSSYNGYKEIKVSVRRSKFLRKWVYEATFVTEGGTVIKRKQTSPDYDQPFVLERLELVCIIDD